MILDTGSDQTRLVSSAARRLGVKVPVAAKDGGAHDVSSITALSEPAQIAVAGTPFTTPLQVVDPPWYMTLSRIDGLVSWREVRDKILVFDPAQRSVTAVQKLPDETAGWVKLGVSGSDILYLETTLTNGKTGMIELDTGNSTGVTVSPAQWNEWRKAHPKAPVVTRAVALIAGTGRSKEAWADEIKLGQLTLTDVPVHMATAAEMSDVPANYAGTLGLYAVARMKLVLDGKNGAAYAQPQPPPGPYYSKFNRPGIKRDAANPGTGQGNWAVSDTVRLDTRSLLAEAAMGAGLIKSVKKDYAGAIAEFSRALDISPNDIGSRQFRAEARFLKGDYAAAEEDCSRILELDPKNMMAVETRGLIRLREPDNDGVMADCARLTEIGGENGVVYALRRRASFGKADYAAAIADCDRALKLEPADVGALLDRGVAKAEQGDFDGGMTDVNHALKLNPRIVEAWAGRAMIKLGHDDYAGGIADLNRALKLAPKNSAILADRGLTKFNHGDVAAAEADLTRAVTLDTNSSYAVMLRGASREIRGDFTAAVAAYDSAITVQPEGSPNSRLHRQLLRRRLGLPADDFATVVNGWKESWFKTEGRFLAGQTGEAEFLAAARTDSRRQQCEACYYAGMMRLLNGDKAGAHALWKKCLATEFKASREYYFARAELGRLDTASVK